MSREAVIVAAKRTPIGGFGGALKTVPAPRLGAVAIRACVEAAGIDPAEVQMAVMGNVLSAGVGQAPARQAVLYAGLPESVDCLTVNKVCGSGLKACMLAANEIALGNADVVVAGGMENMNLAPHLLPKAREGYRMGNGELIDAMIHDGLWDPYDGRHMGVFAEACAAEKNFSRGEQDEFAVESYRLAQAAIAAGAFKNEIAPVVIKGKKGDVTVDEDEDPAKADFDKMKKLPSAFQKDGSVTAGNASNISDGAAAVLMMSAEKAAALNLEPLAVFKASATASIEPKWFTVAPARAMKKLFDRTGVQAGDVDLYEINEAFSLVALAAMREFNLPREKVNVRGGAVSLGHPIGASGARILVTLLHALRDLDKRRGVASLCIGGGEAVAALVERG